MSYELMIVHSLGSASQWSLPNNIKWPALAVWRWRQGLSTDAHLQLNGKIFMEKAMGYPIESHFW